MIIYAMCDGKGDPRAGSRWIYNPQPKGPVTIICDIIIWLEHIIHFPPDLTTTAPSRAIDVWWGVGGGSWKKETGKRTQLKLKIPNSAITCLGIRRTPIPPRIGCPQKYDKYKGVGREQWEYPFCRWNVNHRKTYSLIVHIAILPSAHILRRAYTHT